MFLSIDEVTNSSHYGTSSKSTRILRPNYVCFGTKIPRYSRFQSQIFFLSMVQQFAGTTITHKYCHIININFIITTFMTDCIWFKIILYRHTTINSVNYPCLICHILYTLYLTDVSFASPHRHLTNDNIASQLGLSPITSHTSIMYMHHLHTCMA